MQNLPNFSSDSYIPLPESLNSNSFLFDTPSSSNQNREIHHGPKNSFPWKKRAYSYGVVGLHEEIEDFYEFMHPTEQEGEVRLRVVEHITQIVHSLWPHARVEVFGSYRTGLYLPHSDIDIVVVGEWRSLPLSTLSKELEKNGIHSSDITIIANATVPIVRFTHTPSRIRVDISFNVINGVKGAKFIKRFVKQYPTLPKLIVVLKQFLIQRGLNEVYNGGMSSYCLTLLIISQLQGYHKPKTQPSLNLGTLLLEFFEHYGINFNYEKVSIHFENDDGVYQPKAKRFDALLNVEDPLLKGNNIAKGTFLIPMLKKAFQNAFHHLHQMVTESIVNKKVVKSFLSAIITIESGQLQQREWLKQNYSNTLRNLTRLLNSPKNNQSAESSKSQSTKKINRR